MQAQKERERLLFEKRSKKRESENEIAEFPQREIDRPDRISPSICWVKIQTGEMSPIYKDMKYSEAESLLSIQTIRVPEDFVLACGSICVCL